MFLGGFLVSNLTHYGGFDDASPFRKKEIVYRPSKLCKPEPGETSYLCYGGNFLPLSKARGHSLILGMTRSGKTHLMRASMSFAASSLREGIDSLISFDFKGLDFPFLSFFADRKGIPLYFFNVSDKRSWAIDIAKDSGGYSTFLWELAQLLIPNEKESEDKKNFFKRATQCIIYACMIALTEQLNLDWGLHDVLNLALSKTEELSAFFQQSPEALAIAESFLMSPCNETIGNIRASLMAEISQIMPIAANQYHTPKERWIGINEIINSGGILLVGHDSLTKETSKVVMQLAFRQLYNQVNDLVDDSDRKIHLYIDELAAMGEIPYLGEFLATTAGRGAMAHIASQSWGGLAEIYGENKLWNIVGNCEYLNILRCDSQTADFAVNFFGTYKKIAPSFNFQFKDGLLSHTVSIEEKNEDKYNKNNFTDLPIASYESGINSYFRSELTGIRRLQVPGDWVNKYSQPPIDKSILPRIRKSQNELSMPRWKPNVNIYNSSFAQQAYSVTGEGNQAFLEILQRDV